MLKPIRILIEGSDDSLLNIDEIKYTFRILMNMAGFPCHFIKDEGDNRVDIYYGKTCSRDSDLFIEMANIGRAGIRRPIRTITEDDYHFLLFDSQQRGKDIISRNGASTYIWNDIILSSFYLLSGWQERFMHRDSKDRPVIEEAFLYQEKILHCPLVNQYSTIVRDTFAASHNPLPLWPSNKKYAVVLTHDVDYPEMIRWIEFVRYLAKYKRQSKIRKVLDIFIGGESFWRFEDWIELERRYGMKSAFYFCGFKGGLLRYLLKAPDPFYDVRRDRFKRIMDYLVQNGFEVGLHSSYSAYQSASRFRTEKTAVEEALGRPVLGNRHHYWHMNPNNPSETALIHGRVGLLYDSSIIFPHRAGFRYGICSPFHLYDSVGNRPVITLELPLTLMDAHLFQYAKYSYFGQYQFEIDALLDSVKKYSGVFIADYHVRVLNSTLYPGWGESYEYLLDKINESNDFYCDTPLNIAKYWLDREKGIHAESIDKDCNVN